MSKIMKDVKIALEDNVIEGYALYCFDSENMECRLYPLRTLQPLLDLTKTNELFYLDKPAFYMESKPVFLIIRGFVPSISLVQQNETTKEVKRYRMNRNLVEKMILLLEQLKTKSEEEEKSLLDLVEFFEIFLSGTTKLNLLTQKERDIITEKKFDSFEVKAKLKSTYAITMFNKSHIDFNIYIYLILIVVISVLTTYLIMINQPEKVIEVIKYLNSTTNETISTLGVRL